MTSADLTIARLRPQRLAPGAIDALAEACELLDGADGRIERAQGTTRPGTAAHRALDQVLDAVRAATEGLASIPVDPDPPRAAC
jgi:hypothetical protein